MLVFYISPHLLHQTCAKLAVFKFFCVNIHDSSVFIIFYENVIITYEMAFILCLFKCQTFQVSNSTWYHFSQSNRFQMDKMKSSSDFFLLCKYTIWLYNVLWTPFHVDFNVLLGFVNGHIHTPIILFLFITKYFKIIFKILF